VGLRNALMATIVLPYLGAEAAEQELKRPAPRGRPAPRTRHNALQGLDMRLTYRTVLVLRALEELGGPPTRRALQGATGGRGPSNRQVAAAAGISDAGQISKLLARLEALGLIANTGGDHAKGEPNAWHLTPKGHEVNCSLQARAA